MKLKIFAVAVLILISSATLFAERPGIAPDAEHITPLLPGQQAPDVTFKTLDGGDYNLLEEAAKKPLILIFYRGGW